MTHQNPNKENEFITIIDENGYEKQVEVIHYFTLESDGNDYIVYTDNIEDENGNILIYTSQVIEHDDRVELKGIDSKEVIDEIMGLLSELAGW